MKQYVIPFVIVLLTCFGISAKAASDLWITGSAVPGGTQKLTLFPDNTLRFAGTLTTGTLKVMTTETPVSTTQYLVPTHSGAYIVNHGITFKLLTDADAPGWEVHSMRTGTVFPLI